MPIARDESDPTWCLVPSSLSWPVTRCFRLACCWSCDCYQWHFLRHLDTAAPRKRHMHILPSWLSSPSWPHKHAACWIPLLKNFPRKRGPNGRSTPTCLHRLHCLHGSHDDRCGKRAGARRGVRDPRSGCSNRVNVAPQSRSRLPLTGPILDTQHVRQTTSCTPRVDLESDVALASCSHSLTA